MNFVIKTELFLFYWNVLLVEINCQGVCIAGGFYNCVLVSCSQLVKIYFKINFHDAEEFNELYFDFNLYRPLFWCCKTISSDWWTIGPCIFETFN